MVDTIAQKNEKRHHKQTFFVRLYNKTLNVIVWFLGEMLGFFLVFCITMFNINLLKSPFSHFALLFV